jgi:hypothetical protein
MGKIFKKVYFSNLMDSYVIGFFGYELEIKK